jgi:hypothetical protein
LFPWLDTTTIQGVIGAFLKDTQRREKNTKARLERSQIQKITDYRQMLQKELIPTCKR